MTTQTRDSLGGRIKSARDDARMTQAELAKACGLERTSVTNIERGKQAVSVQMLERFAAVLKVRTIDLLEPQLCCGNFETCSQPCAPRANQWRDRANELQALVNELQGFIALRAVRAEARQA